jgi:hypothetical protein
MKEALRAELRRFAKEELRIQLLAIGQRIESTVVRDFARELSLIRTEPVAFVAKDESIACGTGGADDTVADARRATLNAAVVAELPTGCRFDSDALNAAALLRPCGDGEDLQSRLQLGILNGGRVGPRLSMGAPACQSFRARSPGSVPSISSEDDIAISKLRAPQLEGDILGHHRAGSHATQTEKVMTSHVRAATCSTADGCQWAEIEISSERRVRMDKGLPTSRLVM